jgi:hypothetical protein
MGLVAMLLTTFTEDVTTPDSPTLRRGEMIAWGLDSAGDRM